MLETHSLRQAGSRDLSRSIIDRLQLVRGGGRGTRLELPAGWLSLWLPLRGSLQMETRQSRWPLPAAQVLVARDEAIQGSSHDSGLWLALAGPHDAWQARLDEVRPDNWITELFPQQAPCARELRRRLVRLASHTPPGTTMVGHPELPDLMRCLLDEQRELQLLAERCNGRTPQRRRHTLQRLLRVQQLIERDHAGDLDLGQLARLASYSPWHLIRMYRAVFGETPSEHIARRRLDRAWSLVRESALPVCAITEKLGFESQSAFCRAFKNAYGLTTTQARHLPAAASRQPSPRPSRARPRTRLAPRPLDARR